MSARVAPLRPLEGAQREASHPRRQVWLSASAGTGKTHVLTARVLRLLLNGASPETILCLTFTKAGAAEMAERIHARLARWVRMRDQDLAKELFALDEPHDEAAVRGARRLFARVLDAPGGGLRIQTIHAFCQALLAAFPAEAGIMPGFEPLDGRAEAALARATLAELLVSAERGGDLGLVRDVQALSRRLGESAAESYLMLCARSPDAFAALQSREGIEAKVREALDVPLDVEAHIERVVTDAAFDVACLRRIADANREWASKSGLERARIIEDWLAADVTTRAATLADLHKVWAKADGELRSFVSGQAPQFDHYAPDCSGAHATADALLALRTRAELARLLAAGLRAGQAYAAAYADAKRRAGAVDFDDLIRHAVDLLDRPGIGEWIRFKLDRRTDHILVDEGQDTNARQWRIVATLAEEFYSEEAGPNPRTIFSVGDFKQAIFGFQGSDPVAFEAARDYFDRAIDAGEQVLDRLSLDRSFRSSPPVLDVVNALVAKVGTGFGFPEAIPPHVSARDGLPGIVTLWKPVVAEQIGDGEEASEEGWVDDAVRALADRLAEQIGEWLTDPPWVASRGRPLRPEDILILVRTRGSLAALIVARLHAEGVPVAGVDRLRLDAPLGVKDLMAAIRFVLQPEDDLSLASLLVSPLFGLSQDDLYRVAFRRERTLWAALQANPDFAATTGGLRDLLAQADLTTPYRFIEHILSGPLDGRRKLLGRLGSEARDPIEELANAALGFEREATATLQRFLDWFDRDEVEIARDPSAPLDAVRVMTVHGAKGLQAPFVILADATGDPELRRASSVGWVLEEGGLALPALMPRKEERGGSIADAIALAEAREREEHWRLLYVAVTRAEERLVIGGALGPRARGIAPAESWYQALDETLAALGAEEMADARWGGARHHVGEGTSPSGRARLPRAAAIIAEPAWLRMPAPVEARPPRPLAPSSLGEDLVADPPPSAALADAARRGRLLHALFERLPAIDPARRAEAGERWLAGSAGVADAAERQALVGAACAIIGDPTHAEIFAADALAEAPIAAVLADGTVVAGTVDRLVVADDRVLVVDFKTGRRVPADAASAPEHHLRQMAAYAAALAAIFPGRRIEAALLYTAGPALLPIPQALLDRWKPGFPPEEQKLGLDG
jgi:ATP-dependent helicase/nuclease subunit A